MRSWQRNSLLCAAALWLLLTAPAAAQVEPLPAVDPNQIWTPPPLQAGQIPLYSTGPEKVTPATYPSELTQPLVADTPPSANPPPPPGAKPGSFQQLAISGTWMPAGSSGFGSADWLIESTFALPAPTPQSPLLLVPSFQAHYLDGPVGADVPPRLYDASMQFRWLRKLNEFWGIDLAITPGWHGDFEQKDSQAFRTPARALAAYDWNPCTKVVIGVVYLDREDVNWLPAAGIIWTPSDDLRFDLIVPRPRILKRIRMDGVTEDWIYLATEFGGGSYAIQRTSGASDVMTMSDYRLLAGIERRVMGGINTRLEAGYVFNRHIEFTSGAPEIEPDATALIRLGATY